MARLINTIQELEEIYYGKQAGIIQKQDAPILTTTTGVYNAIFGQFVWSLLNQEANVFGVLPKTTWKISGWRLKTAKAGVDDTGGIGEAGTIPDSVKPTFVEVTNTLKTIAHTLEVSEHQQYLYDKDDGAASLEWLRQDAGVRHIEEMNIMLRLDVSIGAAAAGANYTGTNNLESIDRVISNDSEEDAFGGSFTSFFDIFGLDRDTATTFDSFVDHNSGTDRNMTDLLLRTMVWQIKQDGGNTTVFITGFDTYRTILGLYADQVRYNTIGESAVSVGVNGIQSEKGFDTGMRITSVYGIPMLMSKDIPQDTISRIYALDTSDPESSGEPRIGISIAKPTQYFESGVDAGDPFPIDKFSTQGVYRTMGEIKCTTLQAQGKIRDLQ